MTERNVIVLRNKATAVKENVATGAELAAALAGDKKFRKQLLSAIGHTEHARRRAASRLGVIASGKRLAADDELRHELREAAENLRQAWSRIEKKRSHRLRNTLVIFAGAGAVSAVVLPQSRRWLTTRLNRANVGLGTKPRTIEETIEVSVPVSTAYNQWTQFEDFPLFMDGVDHVQQIDETRLHWIATIGGRSAEWDAKILEQHADRQISWISEDGKKMRGTVTFEPLGESRTRIRLSMSYGAEGPIEAVGSAAGLDARRIRSDLKKFKELIESRGTESGAWRGTISAGTTG
jgi:uncharacterized membrane protein